MDCSCQCWKHKQLTIKCHKCDGNLSYTRIQIINEEDENKIKLEKLRKELREKQIDITCLKMEIRELENA
jgi:hypothetical protein